jgi:hypothetical protein
MERNKLVITASGNGNICAKTFESYFMDFITIDIL